MAAVLGWVWLLGIPGRGEAQNAPDLTVGTTRFTIMSSYITTVQGNPTPPATTYRLEAAYL